jgi:hypothetical protein
MLDRIKTLDAYPRTLDEAHVRTSTGGLVSVLSVLFMLFLFGSEMTYYLRTETVDRLAVDTSRGRNIRITFDVTFPHMPCAVVSVDAQDISGSTQVAVTDHILKKRLDAGGVPINSGTRNQLGRTVTSEDQLLATKHAHDNATAEAVEAAAGSAAGSAAGAAAGSAGVEKPKCLSCYGAEEVKGQCCNTCDEVQEAYRKKGWAMGADLDVAQCSKEGFMKTLSNQDGEGCRIAGFLEVAKIAGNFHFAPGHRFQHAHLHVPNLVQFTTEKFNVSHVINELSFGDPFPDAKNPLDGVAKTTHTVGMFQYYAKVVPTTYTYSDGRVLDTNQFSVTEHFRAIHPASGRGLPGLFINYDLSPIMVQFQETQKVRSRPQ